RMQSARITRIVRQLLNLARPYNLRFETIEIVDMVKSALEGFENNENLNIEFAANDDLKISGDADFLRQVFVNIFQNAQQAMPAGGELKIRIDEERREGKNFAAVKISDTGAGIAPENLEKIFDPFYTTKDIGQGTGLGLAVSRRIVEEHGGTIGAVNDKNGGASFTVYLPKSSAAERE
ncbi:MAG: hypothetical protein LH614_00470, partial [Pyrinomonadaceae bacterium]|nr:hypothetical protein [Pyrinomonadaceae bacterium]